MDRITSHKDLIVWQKSVALACKVYAATERLPSDEHAGLVGQMQRAAIAVASGIAVGAAHNSRTEFVRLLHAARGSLCELETLATIALARGLLADAPALMANIAEVGRLLTGLLRSLACSKRTAHAKACHPAATQPGSTISRPPHPRETHT
jgi:four helix bundle protein